MNQATIISQARSQTDFFVGGDKRNTKGAKKKVYKNGLCPQILVIAEKKKGLRTENHWKSVTLFSTFSFHLKLHTLK